MKCIRRAESVLSSLKVMLPPLLTSILGNFTGSPTAVWGIDAWNSTLGTHRHPCYLWQTKGRSPYLPKLGYLHPSTLDTHSDIQPMSGQISCSPLRTVCHRSGDTSVHMLQQGGKPAASARPCSITSLLVVA